MISKQKIGDSYYRAGYGRIRPRKAGVYLIGGKCYARDRQTWETSFEPPTGELEGYVMVNAIGDIFFQVSASREHQEYKPNHEP